MGGLLACRCADMCECVDFPGCACVWARCSRAASLGTAGYWCSSCPLCSSTAPVARPSLCCREDAGANLKGPGSTWGPSGRQPLAGDVAPDVALEWPGVTREAPSLLRPPVQGAQRHGQNRGTQGAGGCLPSPSRRAGSPQRPHWSTTALCRGVNQGPAREGVEAPVSPGSVCSWCARALSACARKCHPACSTAH